MSEQERRELKAACARLTKALKGVKPMTQETKNRYYAECEKLGEGAR